MSNRPYSVQQADARAARVVFLRDPRTGERMPDTALVEFDGELCELGTLIGGERASLEWDATRQLFVGGYPI